jgi:hypothetical protein
VEVSFFFYNRLEEGLLHDYYKGPHPTHVTSFYLNSIFLKDSFMMSIWWKHVVVFETGFHPILWVRLFWIFLKIDFVDFLKIDLNKIKSLMLIMKDTLCRLWKLWVCCSLNLIQKRR